MVYEHLGKHPTISRVEAYYDDSGDSGQIADVIYLDKAGNALKITDETLASAVQDFVWTNLPEGWEDAAGCYGTVVINVSKKSAHFTHTQRYEEYEEFDIE